MEELDTARLRTATPVKGKFEPAGAEPLYDPAVHAAGDWVAMVTDNPAYRADFPVFRFSDTAWLVALANLAWDQAKILAP